MNTKNAIRGTLALLLPSMKKEKSSSKEGPSHVGESKLFLHIRKNLPRLQGRRRPSSPSHIQMTPKARSGLSSPPPWICSMSIMLIPHICCAIITTKLADARDREKLYETGDICSTSNHVAFGFLLAVYIVYISCYLEFAIAETFEWLVSFFVLPFLHQQSRGFWNEDSQPQCQLIFGQMLTRAKVYSDNQWHSWKESRA